MNCYWPNMAGDAYETMGNGKPCGKNGPLIRHKRHIEVFSATGPVHFVAMNVLGPFSTMSKENQRVLIITDRYEKQNKAVPIARRTMLAVACILFNSL